MITYMLQKLKGWFNHTPAIQTIERGETHNMTDDTNFLSKAEREGKTILSVKVFTPEGRTFAVTQRVKNFGDIAKGIGDTIKSLLSKVKADESPSRVIRKVKSQNQRVEVRPKNGKKAKKAGN